MWEEFVENNEEKGSFQTVIYNKLIIQDVDLHAVDKQMISKLGRFVSDPKDSYFRLIEKIKKYSSKDRYGAYCFWRVLVNGVCTKRRIRFWKNGLDKTCVMCSCSTDCLEHYFGVGENACSTFSLFSFRKTGII